MPLLFSYGTLQQDAVQMSVFGKLFQGQPDELVGFERSVLQVEDPRLAPPGDETQHAIVRFNGRSDSRVSGTVFDISDGDLAQADRYEPATYTRISVVLASGRRAWVYADAHSSPEADAERGTGGK